MLLMFVLPMAMASHHAQAQEVTITLNPGWTWVSYPRADTLDVTTALQSIPPTEGDVIKSQTYFATYMNGMWLGNLQQLIPGKGLMYQSMNSESVSFVFGAISVPSVMTIDVTEITQTTAIGGGEVINDGGTDVTERGICWNTAGTPTIADSHSSNGTGTGSFTVSMNGLTGNTTYYVRAYAINSVGTAYGNEVTFTTEESINPITGGWVDLGLPSGLLWATCNVGASSPEDYGDYFAWGETNTKSSYSWYTYQYCCSNSYNSLTKYCQKSDYGCNGYTDNLTILQSGDDAASANYGGRMPTKEEWEELYNNCTSVWVWTAQNGPNGRLFTGPNGNTLFLPAAGFRGNSSIGEAGYTGYYWSSSLPTDYPDHMWYFDFYSGGYGMSSLTLRYRGYSVRAVREN